VERAENLARLVQVTMELLLDAASTGTGTMENHWSPLLVATAMEGLFAELYTNPQPSDVWRFITTDPRNPDSVSACIRLARENARTVSDQISEEMWAELNELYHFAGSKGAPEEFECSPQAFFEKIIQSCRLFDGITSATLPRNEGWYFMELGRYLERADKISRFVDINSHSPQLENNHALDSIRWSTILRSCSAFATCRRQFGGEVTLENVLELLLFSTDFPRSVRFCLRRVDETLHKISYTPTGQYSNPAEKLTGSLLAKLNFTSVPDVLAQGLHDYIDDLQLNLNSAGQAIFETYVLLPQEVNRLAVRHAGLEDARFFELHHQQQQQQQQ
jgi:uncharacterized alpha-E superfamily protein